LADSHPRFNEVWLGALWLILRNPYAGTLLPGKTATFVMVTVDFMAINLPEIEIYYSIVDLQQYLIEIIELH
jgi:hypothetical protein